MRIAWGSEAANCGFELPPRFGIGERRLAERALTAWHRSGGVEVAGFDASSLVIASLADGPIVERCGKGVAEAFGFELGAACAALAPLAAELLAAIDSIGRASDPAPFELALPRSCDTVMLVRGIVFPLPGTSRALRRLVVMNWRARLGRDQTERLRHEIAATWTKSRCKPAIIDPFSPEPAG